MIHVMLDLETFGTSNDAMIVSIGAVKLDAETIVDRFHVGIDPEDAQRYKRNIDAGAVMWWLDEKMAQARKELVELPKIDMFAALDGFSLWCLQTPVDQLGSLWGNGATFDNVLLRSAFKAAGLDFPFSYKQDACYRTLKKFSPDIEYTQVGTAHNGVADAESQAVHLQAICKARGMVL